MLKWCHTTQKKPWGRSKISQVPALCTNRLSPLQASQPPFWNLQTPATVSAFSLPSASPASPHPRVVGPVCKANHVQPTLAFPLKTSDYSSSLVKRRVIVSVNQCRKQSSKCHFTCNSYNQLPWQPKYPVFRVKYNEYRAGRIMTYQDLQKDMRAQVVSKLRPLLSVQRREVPAEQGRTTKTSAMERKATS